MPKGLCILGLRLRGDPACGEGKPRARRCQDVPSDRSRRPSCARMHRLLPCPGCAAIIAPSVVYSKVKGLSQMDVIRSSPVAAPAASEVAASLRLAPNTTSTIVEKRCKDDMPAADAVVH
jgi:hypothetical protein